MPTRLFHPKHGYHHSYSDDITEAMRKTGWTDAPEYVEKQTEQQPEDQAVNPALRKRKK